VVRADWICAPELSGAVGGALSPQRAPQNDALLVSEMENSTVAPSMARAWRAGEVSISSGIGLYSLSVLHRSLPTALAPS
jgi:hypothetical protein